MEKKYETKEGKTIWVVLILLTVINIFMFNERIMFLPYIAFIIFVCAMFLSYEFKIDNQTLYYQINLFGLALVKKDVDASDIKEIYFVQVRDVPTVLIKPVKGMRWKLTKFKPSSYDTDVYAFAEQHGIQCIKLNGYEPKKVNREAK